MRVVVTRYQYSAYSSSGTHSKISNAIPPLTSMQSSLVPLPLASFHSREAQASVLQTLCAYGPSRKQTRENAFALRQHDFRFLISDASQVLASAYPKP